MLWDVSYFGLFCYLGSSMVGGCVDSVVYKILWLEYNVFGDFLVNCSKNYVIWIGNDFNLNVDVFSILF